MLTSLLSSRPAAALVEKALGVAGDSILYVGDHICKQYSPQQYSRYSTAMHPQPCVGKHGWRDTLLAGAWQAATAHLALPLAEPCGEPLR
jgi:hypothetical protein